MTRFQMILAGALAGAALIFAITHGPRFWTLLSLLCFATGLWIGLGVSFPSWEMFGHSLCRGATDRKVVALTFDDGPDPETTPVLIDLLARHRVKATFFCVGARVAGHPALAGRLCEAGHQVENHTWAHSARTNLLSDAALHADLARAQEAIRAAVGVAPRYFRPPMGLTNQRIFRVARALNLTVTGYTARGLDRRATPAEQVVGRLLRSLRPGAIFLLHDGGVPAARVTGIVALLLERLRAAGYQCVRLDELERPAASA